MTAGNSGLYFRTKPEPGFVDGYEAQVDSTHTDPIRTGSIYGMCHVYKKLVEPDTWFTYEIEVRDDVWRGREMTRDQGDGRPATNCTNTWISRKRLRKDILRSNNMTPAVESASAKSKSWKWAKKMPTRNNLRQPIKHPKNDLPTGNAIKKHSRRCWFALCQKWTFPGEMSGDKCLSIPFVLLNRKNDK